MSTPVSEATLPLQLEQVLSDFVAAARRAFEENLVAVVLFGSAAEQQLRATSDVNLIVILRQFQRAQVDATREPLRLAHAAAKLSTMFALESELPLAAEAFAVKFADIGRRRRVLYGEDVFARLKPTRRAQITRLKQVLMNLVLRLRSRYALVSLREEQLTFVLAEVAAPLRAAAAALLDLEGHHVTTPKAAFDMIVRSLGTGEKVLSCLSMARRDGALPSGVAGETLFELLEIAERMRKRVDQLE